MKNSVLGRFFGGTLVSMAVGLSCLAGTATQAMAQPDFGRGGGPGGGRFGDFTAPALDARNMAKYAKMLGMSADQLEAAQALVEGYQQEQRRSRESMRTRMEEMRDAARDSGEMPDMEQIRTTMEKAREERRKADEGLFGDIKSLLTPEQLEKWPAVERAQRRDSTIRRGLISGERVNLFEIVEDVKIEGELRAQVDAALADYDVELDRALVARNASFENGIGEFMRLQRDGDVEKAQEVMNKGREAAIQVRDVNRKFARQIADMLPDEKKAAFEVAVNRQSFPEVYRPTAAHRAIEAAAGFADLTSDQKDALILLQEKFNRDVGSVNQKLAAIQQQQEEKITIESMMARFRGGDEPDEVRALRRDKREINDTTVESLKKLLTPEQIERLPKPERDEGRGPAQRGGQGGPGRNRPRGQDPT